MMDTAPPRLRIAIACGGTGGHLFPGLAVAECLADEGVEVMLVVSSKEIDRRALREEGRFGVVTLPAIGLDHRGACRFALAGWRSWRLARRHFAAVPPDALLIMGGFTSAPPAVAARTAGVAVVLHEGNAIPGRANRWLSRLVCRSFVCFAEAGSRLGRGPVERIGFPVRRRFRRMDRSEARRRLGLSPEGPMILVVGGSQGAQGVNAAVTQAAPVLARALSGLQFLHLAGVQDELRVRDAYGQAGVPALVCPFLDEMETALAGADAVVGRAGASSVAEFAAMQVPPLLIPFPFAADDHQVANARALERVGAARVVLQGEATPERLLLELKPMIRDGAVRESLRKGLAAWHQPGAADRLARCLMDLARAKARSAGRQPSVTLPSRTAAKA